VHAARLRSNLRSNLLCGQGGAVPSQLVTFFRGLTGYAISAEKPGLLGIAGSMQAKPLSVNWAFFSSVSAPYLSTQSMRAHQTFIFVGNRLSRIHRQLSSAEMLANEYTKLRRESAFLRQIRGESTPYGYLRKELCGGGEPRLGLLPSNLGVNL